MTTIPQRLRTWADRLLADDHVEYTTLADEMRQAAAELEAPAADALPVATRLQFVGENSMTPLIRLSDHLATVAALQARIKELEARQVPASARDEYVVVWPDGGRCVGNTLKAAQDYMSGAVPSCAERGVEPPVIVRYAPAETVPYAPQPDSSKEAP